MSHESKPLPIAVLISGSGSNLQAIMEAIDRGDVRARVSAVVSDQPDAFGLERAARAGVPAECIPSADHKDRDSYDAALARRLDDLAPGLVVLAGFMRILTPRVVERWEGRMLNIHPSLLPAYKGLHTYRRVLEAGERHHGTSVHFVTEELDGGPVIAQARLTIGPDDTEDTLRTRVLAMEHRLYPDVVGWFADGRLRHDGDRVLLDGRMLDAPVIRTEDEFRSLAG